MGERLVRTTDDSYEPRRARMRVRGQASSQEPAEIMLLDDDRTLLTVLEQVLTAAGHRCRSVATPEAALEAVERNPAIRVIVSDVFMPAMDGLQFVDALRARCQHRPVPRVLLLTAQPSLRLAVGALRLGVCDFLTKPIRPSEFVEAVGRALDRAKEELGSSLPSAPSNVAELAQHAEQLAQMLKALTSSAGVPPAAPAAPLPAEQGARSTDLSLLNIVEVVRRPQSRIATEDLDDVAWDLLIELARASHQKHTLSVSDLMISNIGVSSTTLLRRINKLEASGYIDKQADPSDGRREFVSLTAKGTELVTQFLEQARRQIGELVVAPP